MITTKYHLNCDGCPATSVSDKIVPNGWVAVTHAEGEIHTYCNDCYGVMFRSLISPQSRERALHGDAKTATLAQQNEGERNPR